MRVTYPLLAVLLSSIRALPAQGAAAADPHQQIQQILSRPMFRQWQLRERGEPIGLNIDMPSAPRRWIRAVLEQIGKFIQWLLPSSSSPHSAGWLGLAAAMPVILKTLAVVLIVGLLLALGMIIFKSFQGASAGTAPAHVLSRQQISQAMEAGDALALAGSQWLDEAQRLAAEQNFRAMYRALYLALLAGLHQAGKIQHNRNRTNWTYVRQFRGAETERATFTELTALFDRVWYGHHLPEGGGDLIALRGKVQTLADIGGPA